jgi:hypothetical protein
MSFKRLGYVLGQHCNVGPQDHTIVVGISLVGSEAPATALGGHNFWGRKVITISRRTRLDCCFIDFVLLLFLNSKFWFAGFTGPPKLYQSVISRCYTFQKVLTGTLFFTRENASESQTSTNVKYSFFLYGPLATYPRQAKFLYFSILHTSCPEKYKTSYNQKVS